MKTMKKTVRQEVVNGNYEGKMWLLPQMLLGGAALQRCDKAIPLDQRL
jgi:hypothetical protein